MSLFIQNHVVVLHFTQNKSQNLFSGFTLRIKAKITPPFPLLFSPYFSPLHSLSSSHTGFRKASRTPAPAILQLFPLSAVLVPVSHRAHPHIPVFLRCHLCNETHLAHTENHHPWALQILLSFFYFFSSKHLSVPIELFISC